MFHIHYGTDIDAAKRAAHQGSDDSPLRITDAHTIDDVRAAFQGGGLFGGVQTVFLENILTNDEMRTLLIASVPALHASPDTFHLIEAKIDAPTLRILQKHAGNITKHELPKQAKEASTIFALANALKRGDKKQLWITLHREFLEGTAPEAIHGVLFWGAKDLALKSRENSVEKKQAVRLIALLTELPHQARRRGEDLGYALERFVLQKMW